MKILRKINLCVLSLVCVFSFAACGSSKSSDYSAGSDYYTNAVATETMTDYGYYDEEYYETQDSLNNKQEEFDDSARKLIKTYNLSVETEEFDPFLEAVSSKITELNGYIQNMDTFYGSSYTSYKSGKSSSLTIRIPVSNTESFLKMVGEKGNITNQTIGVEDVTLTYVDIESRKEVYLAEQERLLEFLEEAESVEDMLSIEERLSELRYMLESMESQLRTYDNLVDYTTIYLEISEVQVYTEPEPEGYWETVARSFRDGLNDIGNAFKNFFVWLAGAFLKIIIFVLIVILCIFLIKKLVKFINNRKAKKQAEIVRKNYELKQAYLKSQAEAGVENENKSQT